MRSVPLMALLIAGVPVVAQAACADPNIPAPTILTPTEGAVLSTDTVTITWTTPEGLYGDTTQLDDSTRYDYEPDGVKLYSNLTPGQHTMHLYTLCADENGADTGGPPASVTFTIAGSATTTTSTTLPRVTPTPGALSASGVFAPKRRLAVTLTGSLLIAGRDPAVVCVGSVDGTATFKKQAPVAASAALTPGAVGCEFALRFDLPRKVLRKSVAFGVKFAGSGVLGGVEVGEGVKVKKGKKS